MDIVHCLLDKWSGGQACLHACLPDGEQNAEAWVGHAHLLRLGLSSPSMMTGLLRAT